jgi:hypothetical protein
MGNVKTTWFGSKRGEGKNQLAIWYKSIPQEAHVCITLLWIMTQLSPTNLCTFTKLIREIYIIFTTNSNLPIYGCKLRTLIYNIPLYSYSTIYSFPSDC